MCGTSKYQLQYSLNTWQDLCLMNASSSSWTDLTLPLSSSCVSSRYIPVYPHPLWHCYGTCPPVLTTARQNSLRFGSSKSVYVPNPFIVNLASNYPKVFPTDTHTHINLNLQKLSRIPDCKVVASSFTLHWLFCCEECEMAWNVAWLVAWLHAIGIPHMLGIH